MLPQLTTLTAVDLILGNTIGGGNCPEMLAAIRGMAALPALAWMRLDVTCDSAGLDKACWQALAVSTAFMGLTALRLACRDSFRENINENASAANPSVVCNSACRVPRSLLHIWLSERHN